MQLLGRFEHCATTLVGIHTLQHEAGAARLGTRIAVYADEVGCSELGMAARGAAQCFRTGNSPASAATAQRVLRTG